jgi:RimJ/RimL family protein N-acetyltransferase
MKRPPPVALRAVEVDDASVIQSWFDDEGFRQIAGARYPASVQHWREWAERNKRPEFDNATFAIYPADEDILIGVGSLRNVSAEDRSAEIGIFIGFAEHRRRGYGFSATQQLLHFGFTVMGLHRIYCRMLSHNRPGMGLVAACGAVHEGTAREAKFIGGKFHDVENFAVLATEFDTGQNTHRG